MKKFFLVLAVLAVVLAAAAPGASAQMAPRFAMGGVLEQVDGTTLLVHVRTGSPSVQPYLGTDKQVLTGSNTIFVRCSPLTCTRIQLSDLKTGDRLSITGVVQPGKSLYALRVTVRR